MAAELGIVVPALNAARTIAATLQSLKTMLLAGASVVVVDGGSSDGTAEQVAPFNVPVVQCAGNMYEAINDGCRLLGTSWLTWLNADDVLYGDAVGRRIAGAGQRHEILYGLVDFIDADGRFLHCWRSAPAADLLRLYRAGYSPLLQQGTVFRRNLFDRLGGFQSSYRFVADADFWWRALEKGAVVREMTGPPAAAFRVHPNQLSRIHNRAMKSEHDRMVQNHGMKPGWFSGGLPALRFRGRNLGNYLVRQCRRRNFDRSWRSVRSYDLPNADAMCGNASPR